MKKKSERKHQEINRATVKQVVTPKENLLVDKRGQIDHLGYSVYAQTLSSLLSQSQSPFTVGLFAPFGSGKSFMLHQIKYFLQRIEGETGDGGVKRRKSSTCACWTLFMLVITTIVALTCLVCVPDAQMHVWRVVYWNGTSSVDNDADATTILLTARNNSTEAQQLREELVYINQVLLITLMSLVSFVIFIFIISCFASSSPAAPERSAGWRRALRTLAFVLFTRFPSLDGAEMPVVTSYADRGAGLDMELGKVVEQGGDSHKRFIFVDFSAWEYAGCDILWAAIVTNMVRAVEQEIGCVATRLFRILTVEEEDPDMPRARKGATLRLRTGATVTREEVERALARHRVVKVFEATRSSSSSASWRIFRVRMESSEDARAALATLKLSGCQAQILPDDGDVTRKPSSRNDAIEMDNLLSTSGAEGRRDDEVEVAGVKRPNLWREIWRRPKLVLCGMPLVLVWLALPFCLVAVPIGVSQLVNRYDIDIVRSPRSVPAHVHVLSWLPAATAVLAVAGRFLFAMLRHQVSRLNSALSDASGNYAKELGFMYKVKTEIEFLELLLRVVRYVEAVEYKIIISISDLDRCSAHKIRSVLEAVHILLSHPRAPFVCAVAIDPQLAARAFASDGESGGGETPNPQPAGYQYPRQYIDKIINIPFCLPKLSEKDKQRYLSGLLDEADTCRYEAEWPPAPTPPPLPALPPTDDQTEAAGDDHGGGDQTDSFLDGNEVVPTPEDKNLNEIDAVALEDPTRVVEGERKFEKPNQLFFECRRFVIESENVKKFINSNPRSIKRFFNILILASNLLYRFHRFNLEKCLLALLKPDTDPSLAADIRSKESCLFSCDVSKFTYWLLACEQWPSRCCYLLKTVKHNNSSGGKLDQLLCEIYTEAGFDEMRRRHHRQQHVERSDNLIDFLRRSRLAARHVIAYEPASINLNKFIFG